MKDDALSFRRYRAIQIFLTGAICRADLSLFKSIQPCFLSFIVVLFLFLSLRGDHQKLDTCMPTQLTETLKPLKSWLRLRVLISVCILDALPISCH